MVNQMKKNVVVAFVWAMPMFVATVWAFFEMNDHPANEGASFLVLFAAAFFIAIVIAALIVGAVTKTLKASLIGALLGLPLAFITGLLLLTKGIWDERAKQQIEDAELRSFIAAVRTQDKSRIHQSLSARKTVSIDRFMTVIAKEEDHSSRVFLDEEQAPDIPALAVLTAADVLIGLNIPQAEKESGLASALAGLVKRDKLDQLPAWMRLWDKAQGGRNGKKVAFTAATGPGSVSYNGTPDPASTVVDAWRDRGILAWLATGHTFTPEQYTYVWTRAEQPATVEALVAAGLSLGGSGAQAGANPSGDFHLADYVSHLTDEIDYSNDPHQAVRLLTAYLGRVPPDARQNAELAKGCTSFRERKKSIDVTGVANGAEAVTAFERLLCTPRP